MGYRLIDTANAYSNERAVGRGIKESGVDRKDIFLSTKLWITEYENENAVDETLERLGLDYIDLLFIHQPGGNYMAGYRQLEKSHKTNAQIILRWHIQMGFIVIPGTKHVEHVKENLNIFDFKLTDEEMKEIAKINKNERYYTRTDAMLKQFAMWQPEYEKV